MPELPEVQAVVTSLQPSVLRSRILRVSQGVHDVCTPQGFDVRMLAGRELSHIQRRGKRIILTFDNDHACFVHLGMTGQLRFVTPETPVAKHTHLRFLLATPTGIGELRFVDPRRFGGFVWLGDGPVDAGLGPEPLTVRPAKLHHELSKTTRHIKTALLDQRLIAGLGNIYVDEALHGARLHPLRHGNSLDLPDTRRLSAAIKRTLNAAITAGGSTLRDYVDANGDIGNYQSRHRVYGREGQKCRRCRSIIQRIVLGGRGTHFCPACQR
ncbi:MAG: bifunctional DNA-formamidopyrimidine glycosylase/DNA-(apurinic or apyrimidinic site) lyase [Planctomycetota bacterium]